MAREEQHSFNAIPDGVESRPRDAHTQRLVGLFHYHHHRYLLARFWLEHAAQQGDMVSIFYLGLMHLYGKGFRQNTQIAANLFQFVAIYTFPEDETYIHAAQWYEFTANLWDRETQFQLGLWYLEGNCVPQNMIKAFCHFANAIQQGHVEAHLRVGQIVSANGDDAALPFYFYAATRGNALACYLLGKYHFLNQEIPNALYWFQKASEYKTSPLHCVGADNVGEELEEDLALTRFLIEKGFDVIAFDEHKNTPRRLALDRTHLRIARMLQEEILAKVAARGASYAEHVAHAPLSLPFEKWLQIFQYCDALTLVKASEVCGFFWKVAYDRTTSLGKKFEAECQKYPHRFSLWKTAEETAQAASAGVAKSARTSRIA